MTRERAKLPHQNPSPKLVPSLGSLFKGLLGTQLFNRAWEIKLLGVGTWVTWSHWAGPVRTEILGRGCGGDNPGKRGSGQWRDWASPHWAWPGPEPSSIGFSELPKSMCTQTHSLTLRHLQPAQTSSQSKRWQMIIVDCGYEWSALVNKFLCEIGNLMKENLTAKKFTNQGCVALDCEPKYAPQKHREGWVYSKGFCPGSPTSPHVNEGGKL